MVNHQVDVAMFIDWENMYRCVRGKASIAALKEIAKEHGRLVLVKAYADWRERRFRNDSEKLYQMGVDPVYVPTGFKNNVDVKLATDCIDYAHRHPNIGVIVIAAGDGDYVHVVNCLRPMGKTVVAIAEPESASAMLADTVDAFVTYSTRDVPSDGIYKPPPRHKAMHRSVPKEIPPPPLKRDGMPSDVKTVYQDILTLIEREKGKRAMLAEIKQKLTQTYGDFEQRQYGFKKFSDFIAKGAEQGYFVYHAVGTNFWLAHPNNATQIQQLKPPESVDQVYKDMAKIIKVRKGQRIEFSSLKRELTEKYGQFDQSDFGYSSFKTLMEAGAKQGYFELGLNNKMDIALLNNGPYRDILDEVWTSIGQEYTEEMMAENILEEGPKSAEQEGSLGDGSEDEDGPKNEVAQEDSGDSKETQSSKEEQQSEVPLDEKDLEGELAEDIRLDLKAINEMYRNGKYMDIRFTDDEYTDDADEEERYSDDRYLDVKYTINEYTADELTNNQFNNESNNEPNNDGYNNLGYTDREYNDDKYDDDKYDESDDKDLDSEQYSEDGSDKYSFDAGIDGVDESLIPNSILSDEGASNSSSQRQRRWRFWRPKRGGWV